MKTSMSRIVVTFADSIIIKDNIVGITRNSTFCSLYVRFSISHTHRLYARCSLKTTEHERKYARVQS